MQSPKTRDWLIAIQRSTLLPTTRHVLCNLAIYLNDSGECYPSTSRQATDTGLTERTICTHLEYAVNEGWLSRQRQGITGRAWARNSYTIALPGGTEGGSVRKCEGTEPDDIEALKEVQSNLPIELIIDTAIEGTEGGSVPFPVGAEEEKKPKRAKRTKPMSEAEVLAAVPPGVTPELWADFIDMRAAKKKPVETTGTVKSLHRKLVELETTRGDAPSAVLERSIRNNWQDVFALPPDYSHAKANKPYTGGL